MLSYKFFAISLIFALLFALIGRNAYGQDEEVVINEVLFYQDDTSSVPEEKFEWIELFNGGDSLVDLDGWTISGRNATALITLPSILLPPAAYLVVHVGLGTNESDFSDSTGHYYALYLPGTDLFALDYDGVGLYNGPPGLSTLIDFVTWKGVQGANQPGLADTLAWDANEWPESLFFNVYNFAEGSIQMGLALASGSTIGRDSASTDTNIPSDWAPHGGKDAVAATPGKQNYLPGRMLFDTQPPPLDTAAWTLLFYLDGDCYLEEWVFQKMNELELVGSTENLNIVVMTDFHPGYAPIFYSIDNEVSWYPAIGAFRFALEFNTNYQRVYGYGPNLPNMILGERNLGLGAELSGFLQWGMEHYPADKYGLWIFGPGKGWKSSIRDESQLDELHMHELKDGLDDLDAPLDILVLHQSQMAMIEVAKQVSDYTKVLVATEESCYVNSFFYHWATVVLDLYPWWTGEEYGINLVDQFIGWKPDFAVSALKLGNEFDDLVNTVSSFGTELKEGVEDYDHKFLINYDPDDNVQIKIRGALLATEHFRDTNFIDLSHFAEKIEESGIPSDYRTKAQPIIDKLKIGSGVVLRERHGPAHPNAHGLSIYFPTYQTKDLRGEPYDSPEWSYKTAQNNGVKVKYSSDPDDGTPQDPRNHPLEPAPDFLFPKETQWDEFLHRYYEPCADAGKDFIVEEGSFVVLNGLGSSDADGTVTEWYWDLNPWFLNTDNFNADRDSTDEADDDVDRTGPIVILGPLNPGFYPVVLTVWDDHDLQGGTHSNHFETDQDIAFIWVYPYFFIDTFEILKELTCPGDSDGEVKVIPTGGIPPYLYEWSTGDKTQSISDLSYGTYSVTVMDQTGKEVNEEITIGKPPIIPTTLLFPPDCSNHSNGAITISTEGGSPPYNYSWNTGDDTETIDGLPPGVYAVTITDTNGCTSSFAWVLEADDQILPVVEGIDILAILSEEGTFFIDPGDILVSVEDNCDPAPELSIDQPFFECEDAGVNTVILSATDASGNVGTDEVTVTVIDATPPQVTAIEAVVPIGPDGIAWLDPVMVDGGSYDPCGISNLSVDQNVFDCMQLGSFVPVTLTVTDPSGNTASAATQVFVVDEFAPFFISCPQDIYVPEPGPVDYELPEAIDNCLLDDVELESGFAPDSHFPMGETNVTWVAYDSWGNTSSCSFTVTVGQCPPVLLLEGTLDPDFYSSGDSLVSTGTVSTTGSTVFTADRVIALKAPFNALYGADFEARIEPCAAANLTDKPQEGEAESLSDLQPANKPEAELLLYPNPTMAQLHFLLKPERSNIIDMQIRIFDPLGRQVHFEEIQTKGSGTIDVSHLPDALYRIDIRWNGNRALSTFIKIH